MHRHPGNRRRSAGLRCPVGGVRRREAEAALVQHDPGVAGLVALQFGVTEVGQFGHRTGVAVEAGVRGERQFTDHVAERRAVDLQRAAGPGEEAERVGEGARLSPVLGEGERGGVDAPAVVRGAAGAEGEAAAGVEAQGVGTEGLGAPGVLARGVPVRGVVVSGGGAW